LANEVRQLTHRDLKFAPGTFLPLARGNSHSASPAGPAIIILVKSGKFKRLPPRIMIRQPPSVVMNQIRKNKDLRSLTTGGSGGCPPD
jgi:hypothetical protein